MWCQFCYHWIIHSMFWFEAKRTFMSTSRWSQLVTLFWHKTKLKLVFEIVSGGDAAGRLLSTTAQEKKEAEKIKERWNSSLVFVFVPPHRSHSLFIWSSSIWTQPKPNPRYPTPLSKTFWRNVVRKSLTCWFADYVSLPED